jgi:iron(III) transport system ATP-binding protein
VTVNGVPVYSSARRVFVPPNRRTFGMVFQSYAIWPHMNVFDNAAFPLRVGKRKYSRQEIEEKVTRVLTVVGLESFAGRDATMLSGGQQQRLALARALAMEPKLLLLDEPLSNLDAKLRERMRFEIKRLQRELGITTVYVTHDQGEALALSHEIAVMSEGRIVQIGSPRVIYEQPGSQFVADFVGLTNFVDAVVEGPDSSDGLYHVRSEIGPISVFSNETLVRGDKVLISIRPENIELSETPFSGANAVVAKVDQKVFLGECTDFQVKLGERSLLARAHPSLETPVGQTLYTRMNPLKCISIKA